MELKDVYHYKNYIIVLSLIVLSIITLYVRILPFFAIGTGDPLNFVSMDDPLYKLRQIEQMLHNFPQYAWFDPMTYYPFGSSIHWGPLSTLIASAMCIIAGATTRSDIIKVALFMPPIFAAIMVPVIFLLVRKLFDWKTGIIAAIFIAAVSGQYFSRSLYGYLDHHMLEVFFGTLFCLCFIYTLMYLKPKTRELRKTPEETYQSWFVRERVAFAYCILTGFSFLLGLFVMPTMILFAMIVGIYTMVQMLINTIRKDDSWYLVFNNAVIFIVPIIGFFAIGWDSIMMIAHRYGSTFLGGFSLAAYSPAQPLAYLLLIVVTVIAYYLCSTRFDKTNIKYVYYMIGSVIAVVVAMFIFVPSIPSLFVSGVFEFFGQTAYASTVQEARSWTMLDAQGAFGIGLFLMVFGFFTLLYHIAKDKRDEYIFTFIWFLLVIVATIQHVRYEYYAAIPVVILSAIFVGAVISWSYTIFTSKEEIKKIDTSGKRKKSKKDPYDPMKNSKKYICASLLLIVIALSGLFAYTSFATNYTVSSGGYIRMNGDWMGAMKWLSVNTPDTGVDYYKFYNSESFKYPDTAYGVMSWWDYGHLITYIGGRIPNANPFQAGVQGVNGSAAYFINTDEKISNKIADNIDIKYVVTDVEMDTGKFWAMATWFNESVAGMPYQPVYLVEQSAGNIQPAQLLSDKYYVTMISKLHNFDGSMKKADSVGYIEYSDPSINGNPYPSVMRGTFGNYTILSNNVAQYNSNVNRVDGYHATLIGTDPLQPVVNVPALQHYRLVYESPTDVGGGLHYVKIFEYVKGKMISGEGVIEVNITTNAGRSFTYRQGSVDGTFVLPYATSGTPYETKPTSSYHIVDANNMIISGDIEVTEVELH